MDISLDEARRVAARVAARAELVTITLVSVTAAVKDGLSETGDELLNTSWEVEPSFTRDAVSLMYQMSYAVPVRQGDRSVALIDCQFVASYLLPEDFQAENEEFEAYGLTTVIFALHPYLRELVQGMLARLSLPPVTLGVLRLPFVPARDPMEPEEPPSGPRADVEAEPAASRRGG